MSYSGSLVAALRLSVLKRNPGHAVPIVLLAFVVLSGAAEPAQAQPDAAGWVETGRQAFYEAERAHLKRVAWWGGLNAAGGLALALASSRSSRRARWSFGVMSAGWGVVNVGIGLGALATSSVPPPAPEALLGAERGFHDLLLLNLGLNVGYAGVGGALLLAGYRDVRAAAAWRGYGSALILQGAGLLVLDGIAFLAARTRLADLLESATTVSAQLHPGGLGLTVAL